MECPKCRHEHESKFCPECGAAADAPTGGDPSAGEERFRKTIRDEVSQVLDARQKERDEKRKKKPRPWFKPYEDMIRGKGGSESD